MLIALSGVVFVSILLPRSLAIFPGLVGLCAVILWPVSYQGKARPIQAAPIIAMLLVVVLAALSSLWSSDPADALERAGKIAAVLVPGAFLIGAACNIPQDDLDKGWFLLPAATVAGAVLLYIEYGFNFPIYRLLRGIPAGEHVGTYEMNRSSVALILMVIPLIVVFYDRLAAMGWGRGRAMAGTLIYISLFIPVLFATGSQTAQIAFGAGILTLVLFPAQCRMAWILAGAVLCGGILSAPFLSQFLFAQIPQDAAAEEGLWRWAVRANVFPRLEIWDFISRHALRHPWIGSGLEATRRVDAFDSAQIYQPGLTILHPHNAALQVWIEFGLAGAILACVGVVLLLRRIWRFPSLAARRASVAALASVMAAAVMSYGLWQGWWLGLLLMTAALAGLTAVSVSRER